MHITINVINLPGSSQPTQAAGGSEQEQGAMAEVEALNPSTEARIWNFVLSLGIPLESLIKYLRDNLNADPKGHDQGSLVITVECSSLKILEGLWEDYCSGHLNAVAQETLITAEVLENFGLSEIKLKTFISEKEYESGRQTFMEIKGEPEKEYESARQAFSKTGEPQLPCAYSYAHVINFAFRIKVISYLSYLRLMLHEAFTDHFHLSRSMIII